MREKMWTHYFYVNNLKLNKILISKEYVSVDNEVKDYSRVDHKKIGIYIRSINNLVLFQDNTSLLFCKKIS